MKANYRSFISSCNSSNAQRGFTLMELMIVMSIVAILAAVGGPSFNSLLDRGSVQKVSSDLTMSMLLARAEAVRRNQEVLVSPVGGDWEDGWNITSGAETISRFDASDDIEVEGPASITFSGDGRIKNLIENRFELENTGGNMPLYCIYLSTTGSSRVLVDRNKDGVCANG